MFDLNGTGHYLAWGWLQISVANLVVILLMLLLFAAALVLPFPGHPVPDDDAPAAGGRERGEAA